jgi:hypothetical protein
LQSDAPYGERCHEAVEQRVEADEAEHNGASQLNSVFADLLKVSVIGLVLAMALLAGAGPDEPAPATDDPVTVWLLAMREPAIGRLPETDQAFRWVWLRSFHPPVVVRVERQGSRAFVAVKMLDRAYGLGPDGVRASRLSVDRRRPLADQEWESLAELRRAGFWLQSSSESEQFGVDGADWIMDGVAWGERHTVKRWSPESGPFRDLCLAMLKLSGVAIKPDDIY